MNIVQKLRDRYRLDPTVQEAADEIERLRKALQQIANIDYRGPMPDGVAIARRALGGSDGHC